MDEDVIIGMDHVRSIPGLGQRLRDLAMAVVDRDQTRLLTLPDCTPFWSDVDQLIAALDTYGLLFVHPPEDFLDHCYCDEGNNWAEISIPFWTDKEHPPDVVLRVQIDFRQPIPHLWLRSHLVP